MIFTFLTTTTTSTLMFARHTVSSPHNSPVLLRETPRVIRRSDAVQPHALLCRRNNVPGCYLAALLHAFLHCSHPTAALPREEVGRRRTDPETAPEIRYHVVAAGGSARHGGQPQNNRRKHSCQGPVGMFRRSRTHALLQHRPQQYQNLVCVTSRRGRAGGFNGGSLALQHAHLDGIDGIKEELFGGRDRSTSHQTRDGARSC